MDLLPYISESSKLFYRTLKKGDLTNDEDNYLDEAEEMAIQVYQFTGKANHLL